MSSISIIAYLVLTLAIGYAFVYPSVGDISSLNQEKQKQQDSLDMVTTIESKKGELLTKFNNISPADKAEMATILPNSLDFVRLISQIDAVAANYGLSVDKISLKEVSSSVGNSIQTAEPNKPYQSAIIGFSFVASYDKFNLFLNDLEKSLRILNIKSLKIEPKEDGVYSYAVEFETYWLKS